MDQQALVSSIEKVTCSFARHGVREAAGADGLGRVMVPTDSADALTRKRYLDYAAGRHERTLTPQGERRTLYAGDLVGCAEQILEQLFSDPILPLVSELRLELPYEFEDQEYRQILHDFFTLIAPQLG